MFGPSFRLCQSFSSCFLGCISSGRPRGFMSLTTTGAHIIANIVLIMFVRSLHEFILGWRCLWIHVAANDRCSVEAGKTVLAVHLAEAWAPKQTQTGQSI